MNILRKLSNYRKIGATGRISSLTLGILLVFAYNFRAMGIFLIWLFFINFEAAVRRSRNNHQLASTEEVYFVRGHMDPNPERVEGKPYQLP